MIPALPPETFLRALLLASLEGGAFVAAVALACRFGPGLSPRVRSGLWWLACAKLLLSLTGLAPLALPPLPPIPGLLAAAPARLVVSPAGSSSVVAASLDPGLGDVSSQRPDGAGAGVPEGLAAVTPAALLLGLWTLGVLLGSGATVRALLRLRGVVRRAAPPTDLRLPRLAAELARRLDLSAPPRILATAELSSPQVTGLFRPTVLLPAGRIEGLGGEELAMVLCHELVHVAHRDLWLGWAAEATRRLFFFHPLAVWAVREYALAREAACDEKVLRVLGSAPRDYGHLLLRWGVALRETGLAAAAASPSARNLKRRLEMLGSMKTDKGRRAGLIAMVALFALIPWKMVARPAAQEPGLATLTGAEAWVLLAGDKSSSMSGSSADHHRAAKLQEGSAPLLWFRHDGKEYVVRDAATVAKAQAIWRPVSELGARQGELGGRQGELGAKQGEIGSRQGELGAKQGALGAEQGKLGAEMGRLAAEQARLSVEDDEKNEKRLEELDAQMEALDAQMEKLGEQMEALGRQQEELGRQMEPFGEQQEALGRQQEELGRQMEQLSEQAERDLRGLLDEALASGKAQPAP